MTAKEIIESGLLELYAIGGTSADENALIESLLPIDEALRKEYEIILHALETYGVSENKQPSSHVLRNIFDSIAQADADKFKLPPLLSPQTNADEWWSYLIDHKIFKPDTGEKLMMIEFVKTNTLVTYIAWAEKGAYVEEIHDDHLERLFMLQGNCKIAWNGETHFYREGDFIEIPAGTLHRAEATGDGVMILLGQRVAA